MTNSYKNFYSNLFENVNKARERKNFYLLHISDDSGGEWGEMIKVKQLKENDIVRAVKSLLKKIPPSVYYDVEYLSQKFTFNKAVEFIYDNEVGNFSAYTPDYEYEIHFSLSGRDVWSRSQIKQALKKTGRF